MPNDFQNAACLKCPYYESKHLPNQLSQLPLNAEMNGSKVLLVLQAPGKNEWTGNNGTVKPAPIISNDYRSTAARLRNSFKRINKQRINYDISEAVQCYPGYYSSQRDKKPSVVAIRQCKEHLMNDIINGNYDKIISFGIVANEVVDEIIRIQNLRVQHIKRAHPSSGKLSNVVLDSSLK